MSPGRGSRAMPKPRPSLLTKRDAKKDAQANERRVRAAVKQRDLGLCRVCFELGQRHARGGEMHHILPRSLGGKDTTANCIWVCAAHHAERHHGVIRISGDGDRAIHVERIWR